MVTAREVTNVAYALLKTSAASSLVSDAISLKFLNMAVKDVYLNSSLMVSSTTIYVTTGTYRYDLPSNFMSIAIRDEEKNDPCVYFDDGTSTHKLIYRQYPDFFPIQSTPSTPTAFTIEYITDYPYAELILESPYEETPPTYLFLEDLSDYFIAEYVPYTPNIQLLLNPVPNANGTITILFIPRSPILTSQSDPIPLPHALSYPLAYYICSLYFRMLGEVVSAERYFLLYDAGMKKYHRLMSTTLKKLKTIWGGETDEQRNTGK